jgi:hypothetical protein
MELVSWLLDALMLADTADAPDPTAAPQRTLRVRSGRPDYGEAKQQRKATPKANGPSRLRFTNEVSVAIRHQCPSWLEVARSVVDTMCLNILARGLWLDPATLRSFIKSDLILEFEAHAWINSAFQLESKPEAKACAFTDQRCLPRSTSLQQQALRPRQPHFSQRLDPGIYGVPRPRAPAEHPQKRQGCHPTDPLGRPQGWKVRRRCAPFCGEQLPKLCPRIANRPLGRGVPNRYFSMYHLWSLFLDPQRQAYHEPHSNARSLRCCLLCMTSSSL